MQKEAYRTTSGFDRSVECGSQCTCKLGCHDLGERDVRQEKSVQDAVTYHRADSTGVRDQSLQAHDYCTDDIGNHLLGCWSL